MIINLDVSYSIVPSLSSNKSYPKSHTFFLLVGRLLKGNFFQKMIEECGKMCHNPSGRSSVFHTSYIAVALQSHIRNLS